MADNDLIQRALNGDMDESCEGVEHVIAERRQLAHEVLRLRRHLREALNDDHPSFDVIGSAMVHDPEHVGGEGFQWDYERKDGVLTGPAWFDGEGYDSEGDAFEGLKAWAANRGWFLTAIHVEVRKMKEA